MKRSKKIHRLSHDEFAELRAGAEEALAHAQGKKVTLRTQLVPQPKKPAPAPAKKRRPLTDYYARLRKPQPKRLSAEDTRQFWEEERR